MTHEMFHDVNDAAFSAGTTRGYIVPLSIVAHTAVLAAVIVMSFLAVGALPAPPTTLAFIWTAPMAIPRLPAAPRTAVATTRAGSEETGVEAAPVAAPPQVG